MPLIDIDRFGQYLGGLIGGGGSGGPFSGALVSKDADQAIPFLTPTDVTWETEQYDVGDWFASSGDTFFTVPEGISRIQLFAGINWETNTATAMISQFTKNASAAFPGAARIQIPATNGVTDANVIVSPVLDVVENDKFRINVIQSHIAADLDVLAIGSTFFCIVAVEGISSSAGGLFTSLVDTPGSYMGFAGKHLKVNAAENAIEFGQDVDSDAAPTFDGLTLNGPKYLSAAGTIASTSTAALGTLQELYRVNTDSNAVTLTISSADIATGSGQNPWIFSVKDVSGNASVLNLTIATEGAELIDGGGDVVISTDFGGVTLFSDGDNLLSL